MLLIKKAGSLLIYGRDFITSIVDRKRINQHLRKLREAGMPQWLLTKCRKVYSSSHPTQWSEITEGYLALLEAKSATPEKTRVLGKFARVWHRHDLNHYSRMPWKAEELANCDRDGRTPEQVYQESMVGVKD